MSFFKFLVGFTLIYILISFGSCTNCCKNYNDTYVVSTDEQNWFQALINCKSAGMQLATLNSKEDNDNLKRFLIENNYTLGYWLGATNLGNEIIYWATTGQVMIYTNWLTGQPDNDFLIERCVQWGWGNVSLTTNATYYGWNNYDCDLKIAYICEKEPCCGGDSTRNPSCWCQTED